MPRLMLMWKKLRWLLIMTTLAISKYQTREVRRLAKAIKNASSNCVKVDKISHWNNHHISTWWILWHSQDRANILPSTSLILPLSHQKPRRGIVSSIKVCRPQIRLRPSFMILSWGKNCINLWKRGRLRDSIARYKWLKGSKKRRLKRIVMPLHQKLSRLSNRV